MRKYFCTTCEMEVEDGQEHCNRKGGMMSENKCRKCGKGINNDVFTVCENCWITVYPPKPDPPKDEASLISNFVDPGELQKILDQNTVWTQDFIIYAAQLIVKKILELEDDIFDSLADVGDRLAILESRLEKQESTCEAITKSHCGEIDDLESRLRKMEEIYKEPSLRVHLNFKKGEPRPDPELDSKVIIKYKNGNTLSFATGNLFPDLYYLFENKDNKCIAGIEIGHRCNLRVLFNAIKKELGEK